MDITEDIPLSQALTEAGILDADKIDEREKKALALYDPPIPWWIREITRKPEGNKAFWTFIIELEGERRLLIMGENGTNGPVFEALAVRASKSREAHRLPRIGPCRLVWVDRKGQPGYYKIEAYRG